jgi:hypothetical protein
MATDGLLTGALIDSRLTRGSLAAHSRLQLDKDASTREVLLGSGDVTLNDDPQLGTLRSTLAEVIASAMEANCALDCDFTVVNGKGDFPSPELLRTRLMALM